MILFAVFGVTINIVAAYITKDGSSLNQKSVNLHMLEDVLGWIVVLIGSIIMKFTSINILDSIMSIGVAIFILTSAIKNLKEVLDIFLEKTPSNIDINELKEHILKIKGVSDVHHIHVWSMDGVNNFATLHIVTKDNSIKTKVREELLEHGINHVIIETDSDLDACLDKTCNIKLDFATHEHHHH